MLKTLRKRVTRPIVDRVRYEPFGGIVSVLNPPFLAWVTRDYMRQLGYTDSPLWKGDAQDTHTLSAPTEAHCSLTNRCSQHCSSCYMGSQDSFCNELTTEEWKRFFDTLRALGVFHVALGGGEAFLRNDLLELVLYCKEIGLVPNLTTHGQCLGEAEIAICKEMGQVNLSLDGINDQYHCNGRRGSFVAVDKSILALKKADVSVGLNCVVSKKNIDHLTDVVEYAKQVGLNEVEFLKYKPTGRGTLNYTNYALTQEMIRSIYPIILELGNHYQIMLKMDCSFIPAMVFHDPDKEDLEKLGVTGCDGGNSLMAITAQGYASGCSFVAGKEKLITINEDWQQLSPFRKFKEIVENAQEPCKTCAHLALCRCGCRAVALYYGGAFSSPDPECPRVVDYRSKEKTI